ncbi:AT-rich interactive domain-containing protein 4B-like isoform X2 [Cylas formicarius]|nr:AT-rich interactive domain-containing protein 4B-like isoform X2 [Cylas formicarius]
MGLGMATINDNDIKGALRVGQVVQAKHPDRKEYVEATVTKIQDCSQYTVVFDDGDITTLRRTALCLKSGRHFNESETLDQLPLTHPEHFGNPVVGGRRGRRNRHLKDDSSDEEFQEENNPDLEGYSHDIGKVVSIETSEKKRGKDSWFPGVVVVPSPQLTVRVNIKDEYLIRSFKDGRYYTVPKKEVSEFNREVAQKAENPALMEAVQKAIRFLDYNDLPLHWDKTSLFNTPDSFNEDNASDTSDDEPSEEKDRFVAQLYKFMDDSGTPMNKTPSVSNRDIDLHRLFRLVQKMGGYNRVTNHNKWRLVTEKLKMPNSQNVASQVKLIYKKCLQSYETFYRALGVTMHNPVRSTKKSVSAGRSLIRDKDRSTPVNSPKPEKEEEFVDKLEERKEAPTEKIDPRVKKKTDVKEKRARGDDTSDTNGDTDTSELNPENLTSRPKRKDRKSSKDKKGKPIEVPKQLLNKVVEEADKKEEKVQQTRSRSKELKDPPKLIKEGTPKTIAKATKKLSSKEDDKKTKSKKKLSGESSSDNATTTDSLSCHINIGDKLSVYYGPTNESKVTYEAKVVDIDKDQTGTIYLVHYTGWNTRYDEWIPTTRVAENLSANTKAKKSKSCTPSISSKTIPVATSSKVTASKRARGGSVSSRLASDQTPRSSSPASVTSSSSRTKSPAVPMTRSNRLAAKQDFGKRRISAQTDISVQSDSESDISENEMELPRTRSGSIKTEDTYKNRIKPLLPKTEKKKEPVKGVEDAEKEEGAEVLPKKVKRMKKTDKSPDESEEDSLTHPKGRDFDLNQIRSELKGFTKVLKVSSGENSEKESLESSDEYASSPPIEKEDKSEGIVDPKLAEAEKSLNSDDIYEFKEPEPFEFERSKLVEEKNVKKRLPRLFEELENSSKAKLIKSSTDKSEEGHMEKRTYSRIPIREILADSEDEEEEEKEEIEVEQNVGAIDVPKEVDPFDKLVESPSFNLIKCSPEKSTDNKPVNATQNVLQEPLSLFRELPEVADEYSRDMELSDCESQTQIFTRSENLFTSNFSKPSPDRNTLDMEFSSGKTDEGKTMNSDEDDMLQAQIQRVIAQSSSTDDDSCDTLLATPLMYQIKPEEEAKTLSILGISASSPVIDGPSELKEEMLVESSDDTQLEMEPEPAEEKDTNFAAKLISPALQETDSSLLESIVSKPPMILDPKVDDTGKELTVKTGTKIADSILQKFSFIKNNIETKSFVKTDPPDTFNCDINADIKIERGKNETTLKVEEVKIETEKTETNKEEENSASLETKVVTEESKTSAIETKPRKSKRIPSKTFDEDFNSDSSDSEQLIIVRSDDESHTEFSLKPLLDSKDNDISNVSLPKRTDEEIESQSEERNFKFDSIQDEDCDMEIEDPIEPQVLSKEVVIESEKPGEEDQQESNLHSLLFCEEEIPRSPAPVPEFVGKNDVQSSSSVHEIPFASAPGMSNSKMLLEQKRISPAPSTPVADNERRGNNVQAVIDNTPPTTPETTVSNLSPRDEPDDISPNTNDSGKSVDCESEFPATHSRTSLVKLSPYSEEDTQMTLDYTITKRPSDPCGPPLGCRKRRRSLRTSEDTQMPPACGAKRGRKPLTRHRRDSDSDDASEHSAGGSVGGTTPGSTTSVYDRSSRSPRPSKYNFFVEFDPSLDSTQRIAVLQQKLSELRKTYADVKTELAAVERRRKKIRRREREALKTAKQEMACA